jgi:quercetin dioxygenase-like cupin family protein
MFRFVPPMLIAATIGVPALAAPDAAPVRREVLVQDTASWNGRPYAAYPAARPQLTVVKMTIPAHTTLPWHTHPCPNATYVLSGDLTLEDRAGGQRRTVHAGEAFTESVDDVHRSISGDQPTVLIITYSGAKGMPLMVPARNP